MTSELSPSAFQRACEFVQTQGRPLDVEQLKHSLNGENAEGVLASLTPFQNSDGGFGHAIEPDFRTPASTALATSVGLGVLSQLGVGSDHEMVRRAIGYLIKTVDRDRWVWPIINADVDLAPHAPWWNYSNNLADSWNQFRFNPTAELLGYFYEHRSLVPDELLDLLSDTMIASLTELGTLSSFYDIRCCLALQDTPDLPEELRDPLALTLKESAATLDPDNPHANYFALLPTPNGVLADIIAEPFAAYVEKMIRTQEADGSWVPWWDWSEVTKEAWQKAEIEWRGSITRTAVDAFRAHGLVG